MSEAVEAFEVAPPVLLTERARQGLAVLAVGDERRAHAVFGEVRAGVDALADRDRRAFVEREVRSDLDLVVQLGRQPGPSRSSRRRRAARQWPLAWGARRSIPSRSLTQEARLTCPCSPSRSPA